MRPFNELTYYAIPSLPTTWVAPNWLKIELGIFSGRLYFDFDEYQTMSRYVGLVDLTQDEEDSTLDRTSNVPLTAKPTAFLQEWLTVRRKGQDFTHTPMGYLCNGKPLLSTHPFFVASDYKAPSAPKYTVQSPQEPVVEEEEDFGESDDDDLYDKE